MKVAMTVVRKPSIVSPHANRIFVSIEVIWERSFAGSLAPPLFSDAGFGCSGYFETQDDCSARSLRPPIQQTNMFQ